MSSAPRPVGGPGAERSRRPVVVEGRVTGAMHHEVFQWTLPTPTTRPTVLTISIRDLYDGLQRRVTDGFSVQVERLWGVYSERLLRKLLSEDPRLLRLWKTQVSERANLTDLLRDHMGTPEFLQEARTRFAEVARVTLDSSLRAILEPPVAASSGPTSYEPNVVHSHGSAHLRSSARPGVPAVVRPAPSVKGSFSESSAETSWEGPPANASRSSRSEDEGAPPDAKPSTCRITKRVTVHSVPPSGGSNEEEGDGVGGSGDECEVTGAVAESKVTGAKNEGGEGDLDSRQVRVEDASEDDCEPKETTEESERKGGGDYLDSNEMEVESEEEDDVAKLARMPNRRFARKRSLTPKEFSMRTGRHRDSEPAVADGQGGKPKKKKKRVVLAGKPSSQMIGVGPFVRTPIFDMRVSAAVASMRERLNQLTQEGNLSEPEKVFIIQQGVSYARSMSRIGSNSSDKHPDLMWEYRAAVCDGFCEHLRSSVLSTMPNFEAVLEKAHSCTYDRGNPFVYFSLHPPKPKPETELESEPEQG